MSTTAAGVRVMYLNALGRPADDGGLNHYTNRWNQLYNEYRSNKSVNDKRAQDLAWAKIRSELETSGEGRNKRGVIQNAYRTFLGREASASEVNDWANRPMSPLTISKAIRDSSEAYTFRQNLKSYTGGYSDIAGYARNSGFDYDTGRFANFKGGQEYLGALDHWSKYGKNEDRMIPAQQILVYNPTKKKLEFTKGAEKLLSNNVKNRYNNLITQFNNTPGGNYKDLINLAGNLGDGVVKSDFFNNGGLQAVEGYYQINKIGKGWDPVTGAQPPTGAFDPKFYATQDASSVNAWNNANKNTVAGYAAKDLDVTGQYGDLNSFLLARYTQYGKKNGLRGNEAVNAEAALSYEESFDKFTDEEKAIWRDQLLGLTGTTAGGNLTINWDDGGTSLVESTVETEIGKKEARKEAIFNVLATDVLKEATKKLEEQKVKEANLTMYTSLPGFSEIANSNESIVNSLLGDSGIGGIMALTGKDTRQTRKDLEKQVESLTGISSNNTIFNWQKWFDDELSKRYADMKEITLETEVDGEIVKEQVELDQEYRDNFIQNYLMPRFDQSKSMNEFVDYVDTIKNNAEQNVFQTQSTYNNLKDLASQRARSFFDSLKSGSSAFNADFYFDPLKVTGKVYNDTKKAQLAAQTIAINEDWDEARKNGNSKPMLEDGTQSEWTWNQWAYYYGLNVNDKSSFANLHYQVVGRNKGFDPAEDVVTKNDVDNFINVNLIPELSDKSNEFGDIAFMNFVTPAEFADAVLKGVDPTENQEEWQKILKQFGLDDEEGEKTLDEVRDYIIEAVSTGSALAIREGIKYLNQKKEDITQKALGVTYIEREEDVKNIEDPNATSLYKLFSSKGYGGTEEEFYNEFMTDVDPGMISLLDKTTSGKIGSIQDMLKDIDTDPFEALSVIQELSAEEDDIFSSSTKDDKSTDTTSSYFDLFEDDEAEPKKQGSIMDEYGFLFKDE